jgi:YfiH family protein
LRRARRPRRIRRVLERFVDADGFVGYRSPLLARAAVPHLFTTRIAGRGQRALDLGRLDRREVERVARAAGLPGARIAAVEQVHGSCVLALGPEALPDGDTEADGLVSEREDVLVGVHVADCVPVLLARGDGRRVAAVHAGWRGLVVGVLPRAVELLGGGPLLAAIGPCLSLARFEVGPEVVQAFARAGLGDVIHEREGRSCIDLRAAAALQLEVAGVAVIDTSDRCTYTHAEEFYSYRRDVTHGGQARTGRLGAVIAAAPSAGSAGLEPGSSPSA